MPVLDNGGGFLCSDVNLSFNQYGLSNKAWYVLKSQPLLAGDTCTASNAMRASEVRFWCLARSAEPAGVIRFFGIGQ